VNRNRFPICILEVVIKLVAVKESGWLFASKLKTCNLKRGFADFVLLSRRAAFVQTAHQQCD